MRTEKSDLESQKRYVDLEKKKLEAEIVQLTSELDKREKEFKGQLQNTKDLEDQVRNIQDLKAQMQDMEKVIEWQKAELSRRERMK